MTEFTNKDLIDLEKLSRIKCKEDEEGPLLDGIKSVLNYFEQLDEVDTKDVIPCNFVLQDLQQNIVRSDVIGPTLKTEEFLSNAPDQVAQMIKVPTIIKQNN